MSTPYDARLHAQIQRGYQHAVTTSLGDLQSQLLAELCAWQHCEAAVWQVLNLRSRALLHQAGWNWLPSADGVIFAQSVSPELLPDADYGGLRIDDPLQSKSSEERSFRGRWDESYPWKGAVQLVQVDRESNLLHVIVLARYADLDPRDWQDGLDALGWHALQAFQLAVMRYLTPEPGGPPRVAAILNPDGVVLAATEDFGAELVAVESDALRIDSGRLHLSSAAERLLKFTELGHHLRLCQLKVSGALDVLSDRERQLAVLIAANISIREAAGLLGIAAGTASSHMNRIYRKLHVHGYRELSGLINRAMDDKASDLMARGIGAEEA